MADPQTRTTIPAVWILFLAHMKGLQDTSGSGSSQNIRVIHDGEVPFDGLPIPYVALHILSVISIGKIDADKQWEQKLKIRIASLITGADMATAEILSKIAQVTDRVETFDKPNGVSGFEEIEWSITHSISTEQGNMIMADAIIPFSVVALRGVNE